MSDVIVLDAYRPHEVVKIRCRGCDTQWLAVYPVGTDTAKLECLDCGGCDSEVIQGPEPEPCA